MKHLMIVLCLGVWAFAGAAPVFVDNPQGRDEERARKDVAAWDGEIRALPKWQEWVNAETNSNAAIAAEIAAVANAATLAQFQAKWAAYELQRRKDERELFQFSRRLIRKVLRSMNRQTGEE